QLTYRIRTARGEEKWVLEQGCEVNAADGKAYLEGFVSDITERKSIEDQLRQAQKWRWSGS
ncbi:MAG: PAS domain S-box protein, partial [Alphaproteobacteria bacterium]